MNDESIDPRKSDEDIMRPAIFHEIVEGNGKTVKENNLVEQHRIPLGSLVEIVADSEYPHDMDGCRLFVVEHARDFDGTPGYHLSFNYALIEELPHLEADTSQIGRIAHGQARASMTGLWTDDSLRVIRNSSPSASSFHSLLANHLGMSEQDISDDTRFDELGLDSLDNIEIIMLIEDTYGFSIGTEEAEGMTTVNDAVMMIDKKLSTLRK